MRVALFVMLAACGKTGDSREQTPPPKPPTPTPTPTPMPTPPAPPSASWLLLESRAQNTDDKATYLAVELAADITAPPKLVPHGTRPALAIDRWPGHFHTVPAHGGDWWARVSSKDRVTLEALSGISGGKTSRSFAVPFEPAALAIVDDALFVGGAQSVGWFDLSKPTPAYVELVKREQQFKSYDVFVRDGDRLVAIDDEVAPMYADLFALDAHGHPTKRLADWSLPGVINGHYDGAALLRTSDAEGTLFVRASYGIMTGSGQVLGAIPMRQNKLVFDDDITWPNRDGKTPVLVEHQDERTPNGKARVLAGTKLTRWSGMALVRQAKLILLAAGERGVMIVPADFTASTTTATLVDLGGEVFDLREHGAHAIALVKTIDGKGKLVVLEVAAGSVKPVATHDLPGVFMRVVD